MLMSLSSPWGSVEALRTCLSLCVLVAWPWLILPQSCEVRLPRGKGRGGWGSSLNGCKRKGKDLGGFLGLEHLFLCFTNSPHKLTQFSYLLVELLWQLPLY